MAFKKPFRVAVEGNISAGKSSLVEYFKKFANVETYAEPVSNWTNFKGNNLLELLYTDIKRWNFLFQNFVQLSRFKIQTLKPASVNKDVQIFERSLQSNRFCFGQMAFEKGYLTHAEYLVNAKWYEVLSELEDVSVDLIVYVRCSPEKCYHRLKIRNRAEEINVDLSYLQDLHEIHDRWLISPESSACAPVLVLDADKDMHELISDYEKYKDYILGNKIYASTHKRNQQNNSILQKSMKNYLQLCVEGNVASGKTYFVQNLKDNSCIECIEEPIQEWCNLEEHNILQLLYTDLTRWNFLFRSYAQLTFLQSHVKNLENPECRILVLERSLFSNRYVFIEHAYSNGFLTNPEYDTLVEWFDFLIEKFQIKIDHIVYIQSSPDLCLERVKNRGRPEEENIPYTYLERLHYFHEKWLIDSNVGIPVYILKSEDPELVNNFKKYFLTD